MNDSNISNNEEVLTMEINESIKELSNAINSLKGTHDKLTNHIEYVNKDLTEVKTNLQGISKILEKQILHEEKIKNIETEIKDIDNFNLKSEKTDLKLEGVDSRVVKLENHLTKITYMIISLVFALFGKIFMDFNTPKQVSQPQEIQYIYKEKKPQ